MKFTDQEIIDLARTYVVHNGWANWVYDDLIEGMLDLCYRIDPDYDDSYPDPRGAGDHIDSLIAPIWGPHLDFQDPAPWFNRQSMEGSYVDEHGEHIRRPQQPDDASDEWAWAESPIETSSRD